MRQKVFIALKMAGIAGQNKLAGVFRYLAERYGDRAPWDVQLVRTRAELTPARIRRARTEGTDGFILSIPEADDALAALAGSAAPKVVMDIHSAVIEERRDDFVFIGNDGAAIGREAARYLVGQGIHRAYAFLHNPSVMEWSRARFAAFRDTLRDHGFWCAELFDVAAVAKLPRPVAVLAANDDRAFELLEFLRTRRLRVPQDVAVLGINNDVLICENGHPRLSSLQPDFEEEGHLAARTLDEMMAGRPPAGRILSVGVKTIVRRESTAELSHAGRLVSKAVAFIERHALDGIGVKDVVAHLKCSRRLADLRFRQLQGQSILDAITTRRLDEVKRRLLDTRDPIDAISAACGYSNPNYLKNLFKKRFSMTMSAFRQSGPRAPREAFTGCA